jgi:hypothetical protein
MSPEELAFKLGVKQLFAEKLTPELSVYIYFVAGQKAISSWRELRTNAPGLGYWPLVLGDDRTFEQTKKSFESSAKFAGKRPSPPGATSAQEFFEARAEDLGDEFPAGSWPVKPVPPHAFYLPSEFDKRTVMGLLPVSHSSQVLQILNYGGWNACPPVHEHVAVHNYWNERYGAEIVCLSSDILEMQVDRQPASREEALALAREHYLYCNDIVEQGTGTIQELAAGLMASDAWFFWWD